MEGLYKLLLSALVGVVIAGAGAWVTWGRSVVDEPKVIELIETRSPYLEDRRYLEASQRHLDEEVERLRIEVSLMRTDIAEIRSLIKAYVESETR